MSTLTNGSVPPPDGVDATLKNWIEQDNGAHAMLLHQVRREILGLNRKGSWTPSISFATPGNLALMGVTAWGEYRRSGRYMELWGTYTATPTFTTASGALHITGIPIACSNSDSSYFAMGQLTLQGVTKAGYTNFNVAIGAGSAFLVTNVSGSGVALDAIKAADIPSGGSLALRFQISYRF